MMGPAAGRSRVLATVVELLSRTFLRIGNEEYARKHQSRGLTTLQDKHVTIRGKRMQFAFTGKSGEKPFVRIMSMVFQVKDPAVLNRLKTGDKVKFRAENRNGALTVTEIETTR